MAVKLTEAQIDKIHSTRSAVNLRLYERIDGTLYIGNDKGLLERSVQVRGEVLGNSLNTVLNNIGDYSRDEILSLLEAASKDYVLTSTFEDYKKEAKCFTIAMSSAL